MSAWCATNARSARSLSVMAARRRWLSGRLMPLSATSLAPRARACVMRTCRRSGSVRSMTPPIRPSSIQTRSPARTSSKTWDEVQPIVAGFSTRPTLSQAAGRPGVSSRVRMSRSPVASGIAVSTGGIPRRALPSRLFRPRRARPERRTFVREIARARGLGPAAIRTDRRDGEHAPGMPGISERAGGHRRRALQETHPGVRGWRLRESAAGAAILATTTRSARAGSRARTGRASA